MVQSLSLHIEKHLLEDVTHWNDPRLSWRIKKNLFPKS